MRKETKRKQLEQFVLKKKHTRLLREIYEDENVPKANKIVELRKQDETLHFYVRSLFIVNQKRKTVREIVFNLCYRRVQGVCGTCGSPTKFEQNCSWSYTPYCSRRCSNSNEDTRRKTVETCLEKYGVANPSQSKKIKQKKIDTCLANHGVEHPQQSKKVQKKTKSNFLKNWGVENPSQVQGIQEQKIKTSLERYGTTNPMHNPEIFERAQYNAHRVKKFKTQGKSFNYMGYEKYYIKHLIRKGIPASDISTKACDMPEIYYKIDGKIKKYTPDIIYTNRLGEKVVVEIKSTWTGGLLARDGHGNDRHRFRELKAKSKAASKLCEYKVVFINEKGTKRVVLKNIHEMNLRTVKSLVLPLLKDNITNR